MSWIYLRWIKDTEVPLTGGYPTYLTNLPFNLVPEVSGASSHAFLGEIPIQISFMICIWSFSLPQVRNLLIEHFIVFVSFPEKLTDLLKIDGWVPRLVGF